MKWNTYRVCVYVHIHIFVSTLTVCRLNNKYYSMHASHDVRYAFQYEFVLRNKYSKHPG